MKTLYFSAILSLLSLFLTPVYGQTVQQDTTYNSGVVHYPSANDSSFGPDGSFYPFGGKYDPDGNNYISTIPIVSSVYSDYMYRIYNDKLTRFNLDGTIDMSFATNGVYTVQNATIKGFGRFADGSIILYYQNQTPSDNYFLIQLSSQGVSDPSFGVRSFVGKSIVLLKDKSYIISNEINNIKEMVKYTPAGNVDLSFGNQGSISVSKWSFIYFINKLNEIFVGYSELGVTPTLTKYKANGTIDTSFATNGTFSTSIYAVNGLNALQFSGPSSLDSTGKILLFGTNLSNYIPKVFIARLNADGTPDNTFNNNSSFYLGTNTNQDDGQIYGGRVINDNTYMLVLSRRVTVMKREGISYRFLRKLGGLSVEETGLKNIQKIEIVYPNPVKDVLNIKLGSNENLEKINIYSMDGRLVFTGRNKKNNLETLSTGDYMVEIKTDKNTYTKKIVKK